MVKTTIDESLREREQNYRFAPISLEDLRFDQQQGLELSLENSRFWVCETLNIQKADDEFPVNQSYVNTCLIGAYEQNGNQGIQEFISSTHAWPKKGIQNDTDCPLYLRASLISETDKMVFEQCLKKATINIF